MTESTSGFLLRLGQQPLHPPQLALHSCDAATLAQKLTGGNVTAHPS